MRERQFKFPEIVLRVLSNFIWRCELARGWCFPAARRVIFVVRAVCTYRVSGGEVFDELFQGFLVGSWGELVFLDFVERV